MRKILNGLKTSLKTGVAVTPLLLGAPAMAQSYSYSAGAAWGTSPAGVAGALDSAIMHNQNGVRASQQEAARRGTLLPNNIITNYSTTANGVVNQVSVTGNNNILDTTQKGTSTGDSTAQGQFNTGISGKNALGIR